MIDIRSLSPDAKTEDDEEIVDEDNTDEVYDRMRDDIAEAQYEAAEQRAIEDGSVQYD